MAAFSTGGFAPQSQNILFYHSLPFELVTIVILMMGAMNFNLHYALWNGNRREIYRNIEIITISITIVMTFILTAIGLAQLEVYPDTMTMLRKGFYQLISGHTTTGFATIYARQFIREWGQLALIAITIAMAFGACACSTGGGIKALRIGIIAKAFYQDIKKILSPESSVIIQKYHHIKEMILEDTQVRGAVLILLSYLVLYGLGTLVGVLFGYSLTESLFESTSAAANVGLSCGITTATMPTVLKITYIIQMWAGRLEFLSIFTLIGFVISWFKGK
jgi:trk system potassium uptake protein TrkH